MRILRWSNLNNERGSTTILSISSLFFGVLVIFLFVNFVKMFAVSDRANTSAEQASLAGTAVIYDEMMSLIETFEYACEDDEHKTCDLKDDFNTIKSDIQVDHPTYTTAQVNRAAIDELLMDKIPEIDHLGLEVKNRLLRSKSNVAAAIKDTIINNKGKSSGTTIKYFSDDYRIEVVTSATFDSIQTSIVGDFTEDIDNIGIGIEVPFISYIQWINQTITLP